MVQQMVLVTAARVLQNTRLYVQTCAEMLFIERSHPRMHAGLRGPAGISYQLAPRAKISRRDQGGVLTLDQLKAYMRSNKWTSDPYSDNSPFGAVCSRGDLDPTQPRASGCNDAKVPAMPTRLKACVKRAPCFMALLLQNNGVNVWLDELTSVALLHAQHAV